MADSPGTGGSGRNAATNGRAAGLARRLGDILELVAGALCVLLFSLMIVVVAYEVAMRYLFDAPTFWSSELARWAMVWLALMGMAIATRRLDHIKVDILVEQLPRGMKVAAAGLRYLFAAAFAIVMLVYGARLVIQNTGQVSIGLGLPFSYLYLAPTLSAALMLYFLGELVARREIRPF